MKILVILGYASLGFTALGFGHSAFAQDPFQNQVAKFVPGSGGPDCFDSYAFGSASVMLQKIGSEKRGCSVTVGPTDSSLGRKYTFSEEAVVIVHDYYSDNDATKKTNDSTHTFLLFPRLVTPHVEKTPGRLKVTIATGDVIEFDITVRPPKILTPETGLQLSADSAITRSTLAGVQFTQTDVTKRNRVILDCKTAVHHPSFVDEGTCDITDGLGNNCTVDRNKLFIRTKVTPNAGSFSDARFRFDEGIIGDDAAAKAKKDKRFYAFLKNEGKCNQLILPVIPTTPLTAPVRGEPVEPASTTGSRPGI